MMCTIYLPPNQPTDRAANHDVGGEMLLSKNSGCADGSSQTIHGQLGERPWVFVRDYAGNRPRHRGVVRRKRVATLEKVSRTIALVRSLPAERIFERCVDSITVDCRFRGKDTGLSLMVIVRDLAPKIEPTSSADHGVEAVIRNLDILVQFAWIGGKGRRNRAIRRQKST